MAGCIRDDTPGNERGASQPVGKRYSGDAASAAAGRTTCVPAGPGTLASSVPHSRSSAEPCGGTRQAR